MIDVKLPFPAKIESKDLKSFYVSFLCRFFVIQRQEGFDLKITKSMFRDEMKKHGWSKQRILKTWKSKDWGFFNASDDDYIILKGKESISNEGGFITYVGIDDTDSVSFYKFCQFVSETYAQRPVTQKEEFYSKFKFKKSETYNREIFKRSLWEKSWRGLRKIAEQSWCSLKTAQKRTTRSTRVKTLKRYDTYNGFRIRKTNLYFNLQHKVYISYNKRITGKMRLLSLSPDHNRSLTMKALFLNNSISLHNSDDTIYENKHSLI